MQSWTNVKFIADLERRNRDMLIKADMYAAGGGDDNNIIVGIEHMYDELNIKTSIDCVKNKSNSGLIHHSWGNTTETHTASNHGAIFDFTIDITSNISLRIYSTKFSSKTFKIDVIKNGSTIESGIDVFAINTTNLSYHWLVFIEIQS